MNDYIVESVAKEAISKRWIMSFLNMIAKNPQLSLLNQAMLYFQMPSAGPVSGRVAWQAMGREVKKDAIPIIMYLPEITIDDEGDYTSTYNPINVFCESQTTGEATPESSVGDIVARILLSMGATTESVEKEVIGNPAIRGFYDEKKNIFVMEKGMDADTQIKTMLELFVEYMLGKKDAGKMLILSVKYVLLTRYKKDHTITEPLFSGLDRYSDEEKLAFIIRLHDTVSELVQVIEGRSLSFDETAFVNCLLTTPHKDEAELAFMKASEHAIDDRMADNLRNLAAKVMYSKDGYIEMLYRKRMERRIFTYPPQEIELEETDYLEFIRNR